MTRKTHVDPFMRTLADGRQVPVAYKTHGFSREIADEQYDPLPDVVVEKISAEQILPQDFSKTARITFKKGNELWAQTTNRYDVLNFDAKNVPEYDKVPEKALPNQIIRVGAKYYLGDKKGRFRRTFPPTAKKYRELKKGHKTHELEGEEGGAWRKEHTLREMQKGIKKRESEQAAKRKRKMHEYSVSRNTLREARKAGKDRNLLSMPGWHTIRTVGYGSPRRPKPGGVPFAVLNEKTKHYDNYYTWPGKKEREKMIEKGEIKA